MQPCGGMPILNLSNLHVHLSKEIPMKSHRIQLPLLVFAFVALFLLAACGGGQTAATVAPASTEGPRSGCAATQPPATTAPEPTAAPTTAPAPTATTPPTTAPEPTQPPAPTAAPAAGGRTLDEVMAAARAQLTQKGYRSRILLEASGTKTEMSVEFVAPDRYHIVSPATEMIIIADKTYMNQEGTWTKIPMDYELHAEAVPRPGLHDGVDRFQDEQCRLQGSRGRRRRRRRPL